MWTGRANSYSIAEREHSDEQLTNVLISAVDLQSGKVRGTHCDGLSTAPDPYDLRWTISDSDVTLSA
ncbi:hypothetical protein JCM7447_04100 [Corynebacterium amycolatum]|uniref:hypothetical protein n=1 Tax=Corynebacterium sp. HMSC11H10 TaxID=1581090 RepID=UPI001439438D|nr:hypothetical protein [Corynebacterium sp. HMSC11H10]